MYNIEKQPSVLYVHLSDELVANILDETGEEIITSESGDTLKQYKASQKGGGGYGAEVI